MWGCWLLGVAVGADGDPLFSESWRSGTGAWRAIGDPIVLVEVAAPEGTRVWQHETVPASGGRVFTVSPIPVRGGARHCLSARVHATAGAGPFLGLNLSDAGGTLGAEHWLIGVGGNGDGYGGLVTAVTDDPTRYDAYTKEFVVEAGATHVVLKDELWINGAPGAADFTDIRLVEGGCSPGDSPPDDTLPDDTDLGADTWTDPVSAHGVVAGFITPETVDDEGCGCSTSTRSGSAGMLLVLTLLARRKRAFGLLLGLAACTKGEEEDADDRWSIEDGMKEGGVSEPPPLWVDPEHPMSRGLVRVRVDDPMASHIALSSSGPGCGGITGGEGATSVELNARAALRGGCVVRADISPSDGSAAYALERRFEVQASDPDLPPFQLLEGVWIPGPPVWRTSLPDAPSVPTVTGPTTFINGATLSFEVEAETVVPLRALVVTVGGHDGAWLVPLDLDDITPFISTSRSFTLRVPSRYFDQHPADSVQLGVQALDVRDALSATREVILSGQEVGTGDVQVGISWAGATDVDLHVTEPSGEEVYYGSPLSSTGGQLDLDSNAGCSIDGVNHENVFWPAGQSAAGTYQVSVQMYNDCGVGGSSGSVTLTWCGPDSPRVEPFTLGPTGSSASWTFDSSCGGGKRAAGRIRYEDFAAQRIGYSASAFVPARHVTVRLLREEDGRELAVGRTDDGGVYDLPFENDGKPGFRVEVQAQADTDQLHQQVLTLDGALYIWQSEEVFDDSAQTTFEGLDLDIPEAANGGALNLFEMGVRGSEIARAGLGRVPPMLTVRWTHGGRPGGGSSSYYSGRQDAIFIAGDLADPDVYDDWVMAHEYGHFVTDQFSWSDSSGDDHATQERVAPSLAWDEGFATWFATQVMRGSTYIDHKGDELGLVYDVETLPPDRPLGNADDQLGGDVSEAVVTAVLLDISDDLNEPRDTIWGRDMSMWYIVRHPLRDGHSDRGADGRDLVDFLDMWICAGFGELGATDEDGLRGNVGWLHRLSYDYAPACR